MALVVVTRIFRQGRGAFYDCHAIDVMACGRPKATRYQRQTFQSDDQFLRTEPNGSLIRTIHCQTLSGGGSEGSHHRRNRRQFQGMSPDHHGVVANQSRVRKTVPSDLTRISVVCRPSGTPRAGRTMELSNLYDHAWLNGSNEYIMSDNPNFNPNWQLSGNWNQLQPVRPAP